ncbi:vacuolar membrane protein-domain-containing protein [Pisolithus thermaeus]|nr:vacuolar membrane protein-domain-containing protein [Pisolithus croceorrhizus]KAI6166253.1 vacuolar membrane protein-domain-containing protein [Pisolithus thermaeus]
MSAIAHIIDSSLDNLPVDRKSCQLLGPTALVVQGLMGVLAILSLVYKRHREIHKRPWKIWLFDVSKQVIGQMFIHGLNVLISDFGSHRFSGNACTYYFLNILVDTTLGVGLIYLVLQATTFLLSKKLHLKGFRSGQYGNPPSLAYWARQAAVYVFSLTTMKFLVVALFAIWPGIFRLGDWLLDWTSVGDGESFQVIFVMGIFPIIMNVLQFWLIDSIVKANTAQPSSHSSLQRNCDDRDREPLIGPSEDDGDDVLQRDVEDVPRPFSSRTSSHVTTMVGPEDDKSKTGSKSSPSSISFSGSNSPTAHDYPPSSVGSSSSGSISSRSRQKHRASPPPSLEHQSTYSLVFSLPDQPQHTSPRMLWNGSGPRISADRPSIHLVSQEKDTRIWPADSVDRRSEQTRYREKR